MEVKRVPKKYVKTLMFTIVERRVVEDAVFLFKDVSDNKFLNIETKPCADESSFVLDDGYIFDPPISQEEIDEMTCKDTDIERITVQNSEGKDISWDVILKWEDYQCKWNLQLYGIWKYHKYIRVEIGLIYIQF